MSQNLKERIRISIEEVYNKGNLSWVEKDYAPNLIRHQSARQDLHGMDEFKAYIKELRDAYSDLTVSADEIIVEGDTSVVRGFFQGTNTGESASLKVPATGKMVRVPYCSIAHWKNNLCQEEFNFLDMLLLTRQLGLMPAGQTQAG